MCEPPRLTLVTRPARAAGPLIAALEAAGRRVLHEPMSEIVFMPAAPPPSFDGLEALIVTSAAAIEALRARAEPVCAGFLSYPLYAVGPRTAAVARAAGFSDVREGPGESAGLAARILSDASGANLGSFLHLCGSPAHTQGLAPLEQAGAEIRRWTLYRAPSITRLSPQLRAALRSRMIGQALFFSPRAARIFVKRALAEGPEVPDGCGAAQAFALSAAVAEALLPLRWGEVRVAGHPTQESLLADFFLSGTKIKELER